MQSGDTIGKYRVLRRLGRGGMGEVWLATAVGHGGFEKNVVLKTLLPELQADPLFVDMLANEARIGAKLSHPNLIEVLDFLEQDGVYVLAMEYVVGRGLHQVLGTLKQRRQLPPLGFALRIALDCCRGLEYAHDQGIIHCDLSPSNVMVTRTGITKVLDFGVAHAASRGPKSDRLKGKLSYMAPERIESLATDRRTDVYSLGVLLYLMVTGQLPFVADSDVELLHRIVHVPPRPPSTFCEVDPRVEQVVLRAMQPDPAARYPDIAAVLAALSPCAEQLGVFGQQDAVAYIDGLFAARPVTDEVATIPGETDASERELRSFDIELESDLELPRESRPAGRRLPTPAMFASGSEAARDAWGTRDRAEQGDFREARTSVQSLFERPALAPAEGGSALWDVRPPQRGVPVWLSRPRVVPPEQPGPPSPPKPEEPAWPWPCSRVKSQ
jgi:eukaryotic-like serine/threonine-protein kinase